MNNKPMRRCLAIALTAIASTVALAAPAQAKGDFGPIVQTGTILAPGLKEAVHVRQVGRSGITAELTMQQTLGVFTTTGTAKGLRAGQVAVSVQYRSRKCTLDGSESIVDFIIGVYVRNPLTGVWRLVPLPKSTSTVDLRNVNAISVRVVKPGMGAQALLSQLRAGTLPSNAIPTIAPAQACAVR